MRSVWFGQPDLSVRYTLLWIDMQISQREIAIAECFRELFDISRLTGCESLEARIETVDPALVCFDFDFPTKQGLQTLKRTKVRYANVPILMLTVQHSESLAVWAFRSGVWDYLVKPVGRDDMDRCLCSVGEMLGMRALQPSTRSAAGRSSLIPDENRWCGPRGSNPLQLAPAVEYVERAFRERITSAEAAQRCNLTTFQLSRVFKETYGMTFQEYVIRFRIREACRLLKNPEAEIAEVAFMVGFQDPSYFGKVFRKYMACTPSQFLTSNDAAIEPDLLEMTAGEH
jgi:YesN/AraC family two-component response regulator